MARLFISLYLLVMIALVGLSAALEQVFFDRSDVSKSDAYQWVAFIQKAIHASPNTIVQWQQSGVPIVTVPEGQIQWPQAQRELLSQGLPVLLSSEHEQQWFFSAQGQLYAVTLPTAEGDAKRFWLYSSVFFILLGLVLAAWSWPLWRDLLKLQKSLNDLQDDGTLAHIQLAEASVVAPIAKTINQLSERLKSLLATQRELTGAVAHEFRTPLARLKFAMAMQPDDRVKKGMQADILELESLVQEMLDFTQLQVASPELNMAEIPLLKMTQALVARLCANKPAHIQVHVDGEAISILADEHYLQRAMQNLIVNGVRHARAHLWISIQQENDEIHWCIDDDGEGIPVGLENKLFEPFYRPDSARARKQGGAGLGLAIVKRIIDWHGGRCWAQSASQGGARFVLALPLVPNSENH